MRLIDADELLKAPFRITGNFGGKYPFEAITVKMVEAAPTINPIHAAGGCYCHECDSYVKSGEYEDENGEKKEFWYCEFHSGKKWLVQMQPSDFCSYGELKETQDDG